MQSAKNERRRLGFLETRISERSLVAGLEQWELQLIALLEPTNCIIREPAVNWNSCGIYHWIVDANRIFR
jgi:hypothetical protein